VLNVHESCAIVERVNAPSNWVVFLIPTHIQIDLKLAGVDAMTRDVATNAKEWVIRNALHRRVVVRISSWDADERCFIGSFVQGKGDEAVQQMVREGLLTFCEMTAELSATADLYVAAQTDAVAKKVGLWERRSIDPVLPRADAEGPCVLRGRRRS
jgi:endonuclease YncB( thermonuclease family)